MPNNSSSDTTLTKLRADAEELMRQLPNVSLNVAAAEIVHAGAASRKRAGSGEHFWQFRHYAQTDAADQIDWRRSARSDEYFVRETELETARSLLFWCDPHAGFDWSSRSDLDTKAYRAKQIMLAVGMLLARAGERIGVLNGERKPSFGRRAPDLLAEDLSRSSSKAISPPRNAAMLVVASDFYDPIDTWRERLLPLAERSRSGVLLAISDPVENEFPFEGRTKFQRPGTTLDRIFGRAETVRDTYLEKYEQHMRELENLAKRMGWAMISHRTDQSAAVGAAALAMALERFDTKA